MKKFRKILFTLVVAFACVCSVDAASGTISVTTGTSTAVVGSTFTVNVRVRCSEAIGSWRFSLNYDSSYISLVSGDTTVAGYGDGAMVYKDYTYRFKAIKSGSAGIRIASAEMIAWNDPNLTMFTPAVANAAVSVKTQAEIQASYSKDNSLRSLAVEGYEITPAFDKNTLEYSVSVPDTAEKINVSALVNDATARVTGTGEIDISEGANKIELVVTAQNGSVKTYTLNVDVRDLNPITAPVDGKDYTVVKKDTLLSEPVGFTKTTIKIGDEEVPAFKNDNAGLTVVGLKDSSGKIGMFLYDENSKTYKKYLELKNSSLTLLAEEIESVPEGFEKTTLDINGEEYEVMKSKYADDFYVIYAMNVETGEKGYYQFDKETHNYIRFNAETYKNMFKENKDFKLYFVAASGVALLFFLLTIIKSARVSKLKKLLRKVAATKLEEKKTEIQTEVIEESVEEVDYPVETTESGSDIPQESEEIREEVEETSEENTSSLTEDELDDDFLDVDRRQKKKKHKRR